MSASRSTVSVARLVNRHLSALVSEARESGIGLEDLTIELAAHASCAALTYWTAQDLHGLLDAAAAEAMDEMESGPEQGLDTVQVAGRA